MACTGIVAVDCCECVVCITEKNSETISGLLRQPKWGHLRDLHKAIKQAEPALTSGDPTIQSIGNYEKVGQVLSKMYRLSSD